jgi:hypothetical protein
MLRQYLLLKTNRYNESMPDLLDLPQSGKRESGGAVSDDRPYRDRTPHEKPGRRTMHTRLNFENLMRSNAGGQMHMHGPGPLNELEESGRLHASDSSLQTRGWSLTA